MPATTVAFHGEGASASVSIVPAPLPTGRSQLLVDAAKLQLECVLAITLRIFHIFFWGVEKEL